MLSHISLAAQPWPSTIERPSAVFPGQGCDSERNDVRHHPTAPEHELCGHPHFLGGEYHCTSLSDVPTHNPTKCLASQTLSHALYHLAEKPELVAALREEIETAIAADGWTAPALGKMWKLDSLLRETLRYYGVSLRKPPLPCPLPRARLITH